jgi:alpha-methylacyl-CoA racemase
MTAESGQPLSGIRVLDFTRLLPGPVCTLYLADLGADVIKVEDVGAGDYARRIGAGDGGRTPAQHIDGDAPSVFYRNVNRGKRSLAIDLKTPAGRDAMLRLIRDADVVVESFRPGVMASLGLDYAATSARNPRIVHASITGYGQHGPRAAMAGHDINYLGYAGVLDQTGVEGGAPALSNLQIADLLGGAASAAIAILAALTCAARNGRGARIDVAMADAVLAHQHFALQALQTHGHTLPRGDDLLSGGVPCYGIYPTRDGRYLAVGALEAKFWRLLCATLGRDDLVAGQLATGAEGARVRAQLGAQFATQTLAHWVTLFDAVDCCVTPVATLDEALHDPQFAARGMVGTRADGTRFFAPPWKIDGAEADATREAPMQGEHSREVLREAGFDAASIGRLVDAGIVRTSSR